MNLISEVSLQCNFMHKIVPVGYMCVLKKLLDKFMCISCKIFKNRGRVFPGWASF